MVFIAGLIVLTAIGSLVWLMVIYPKEPHRGSAEAPREVRVEITEGMRVGPLARELADADVVGNAWVFASYLRILGAAGSLREGRTVVLGRRLTPAQVARRVATGLGISRMNVTIPEGYTLFDIADRLDEYGLMERERFLEAAHDPENVRILRLPEGATSVEGYLFPDTYSLTDNLEPIGIFVRMTRAWKRRVGGLLTDDALEPLRDLGYGPHEALVLASVVEREAAVAQERPVIAGVFLNRLRSTTFLPRHRLQADPTVSYGCLYSAYFDDEAAVPDSCQAFRGRISRAMLQDPANRFNTYRHGGLPPAPICNPGVGAVRAVLEPASHDYLYFVARGGRRHHFSATLDEHNAAVNRYIRGQGDESSATMEGGAGASP